MCLFFLALWEVLKLGSISHPTLFFNIILAVPGLLPLHINFRISSLIPTKNPAGILVGMALSLQIKLGRVDILTVFSSVYEHGISLHLFSSLISFIRVL